MTKLLFSFTAMLFLISFHAEACRPAPLAECQTLSVTVNEAQFRKVLKAVEEYQTFVDAHIVRPENVTSCFNNHFGVHYGQVLLERLEKSNFRTCKEELAQAKSAMIQLIDENSRENESVTKKSQKTLKKKAKIVAETLRKL